MLATTVPFAARLRWRGLAAGALAALLAAGGSSCEGTHVVGRADAAAVPDWRLPDQPYRRRLRIDNRPHPIDLVNFPVMVLLNQGFEYALGTAAGTDLRFVEVATGQILPHEIERWTPSGNSIVWFRVPRALAGSNANFVDLYFGSRTAIDAQDPGAVFSNGFVGVYHLTGNLRDSTTQHNDGIDRGTRSDDGGQIGGARLYPSGTSSSVVISHKGFAAGREPHTMCTWARTDSATPEYHNVVAYGLGRASGVSMLQHGDELWVGGGDIVQVRQIFATGVFRYLCASFDGTRAMVFVDGVAVAGPREVSWNLLLETAQIGGALNPGPGESVEGIKMGSFQGLIDEVRISNVARSADWIAAEYRSTVGPAGGFVTLGALELRP